MATAPTVTECVRQLLDIVAPHRASLGSDTFVTISNQFGVAVTERPERRGAEGCGVDGAYFPSPPRIVVAASESIRRRAFTALHELAHHLIRHNWSLFVLAARRSMEEKVCNEFAAEILAPQTLCDEVLTKPDAPSAAEFAALFKRSHASRAVCARRVAARLRRPGHAVVAKGTVVTYCASSRIPFRAKYGTEQGEQSIFAAAVADGAAQGPGGLIYRDGFASPLFDADAVYDDGHVFAIFTTRTQ